MLNPSSLAPNPRPSLPDASAEGFAAISRAALSILDTLHQAEAVSSRPCSTGGGGPAHLRRELLAALERLGYFPKQRRDVRTDREALELLREALPTDETSLALIHLTRALSQSHLTAAMEELDRATEWARRAVLSPL